MNYTLAVIVRGRFLFYLMDIYIGRFKLLTRSINMVMSFVEPIKRNFEIRSGNTRTRPSIESMNQVYNCMIRWSSGAANDFFTAITSLDDRF